MKKTKSVPVLRRPCCPCFARASVAALLAARLARRDGDVATERAALERALLDAERGSDHEAEVSLELAKLFEHRVRCLESALEHAARAALAEGDDASAHRIARLEGRIERARSR